MKPWWALVFFQKQKNLPDFKLLNRSVYMLQCSKCVCFVSVRGRSTRAALRTTSGAARASSSLFWVESVTQRCAVLMKSPLLINPVRSSSVRVHTSARIPTTSFLNKPERGFVICCLKILPFWLSLGSTHILTPCDLLQDIFNLGKQPMETFTIEEGKPWALPDIPTQTEGNTSHLLLCRLVQHYSFILALYT